MLISVSKAGDMLGCRQVTGDRTRLKLLELHGLKHVDSCSAPRGISFLYKKEDVDKAYELMLNKPDAKTIVAAKGKESGQECMKILKDIKDAVETNAGDLHDINKRLDDGLSNIEAKLLHIMSMLGPLTP